MNIITLFCEIETFFLLMRNGCQHSVSLRRRPLKHAGDRDGCIQVRWRRSWSLSSKATIGRLSIFISNTSASIGAPSFHIWWVIVVSCGCKKKYWRSWRFIFQHTSALVAGSLSWIPHVCASAITGGFHRIASLCQKRDARKHLWGGFTGLNFTSLSIT